MGVDLGLSREKVVRAASRTLASLVEQDEEARDLLAGEEPLPDGAGYLLAASEAHATAGIAGLRRFKRRRLLQIAARDLAGEASLEEVGRALADLADACLDAALVEVGAPEGLAIVAMGKLGARELNYVSDIDVMFVTDSDLGTATKAAEGVLSVLGEVSPEGRAYEIDTNLRPEGRSGALVRSLDGYLEYYDKWAKEWEFQALIKARAGAGNLEIAQTLVDRTRPLVFPTEVDSERIARIRKMKERVEDHAIRSARRARSTESDDVKLGPGGIRDIEFAVQLLQLVHGGADATVRPASTLDALATLVEGGYVADDDGAGMSVAYRWLRTVEHRLQLRRERRVRHIPKDQEARSSLARVMGFKDSPLESAAARFERSHQAVLTDVRARFEKLFYRPMIESLAYGAEQRLSSEALGERLRVLGFRDVDRAARTLEGLVSGTTRRARLFRVLTPALLRWLSTTPLPDEGLFSFLRLGETLGERLDALGALRDNPPGIEFLAKVLGSSRLLGDLLGHVPEELHTIADPRRPGVPKERPQMVREALASLEWREPQDRLDGLRRFKRREMLRVALCDIAGTADEPTIGAGLADLADACLEAALDRAGVPFAVIGMGKLGGRELNYSSDIDVMFVHDGDPLEAEKVAEDLMRAIGSVTPEGQAFKIDAGLRPEGKSGPLARSIESYLEYYERWADPWEHQALLKARHAAGDAGLGERLVNAAARHAFPESPAPTALGEIRHLKARMERERIPRGTDRRRNLKLGPGGLSDIEFTVQITQLLHGHRNPTLRVTNTTDALDAARDAGIISESDASRFAAAYSFLTRLRNRLFLLVGRPVDALPDRAEDLEALGVSMGYNEQPRQELEEEYLRHTRRVRRAAEPIIYG